MNKLDPKEEIFKTKMEDFAPLPPTMVWENVSQSIRNKKRRRLFWLWIPLLLTLSCILLYLYHNPFTQLDTENATENKISNNIDNHYEHNPNPSPSNNEQNINKFAIDQQNANISSAISNQSKQPVTNSNSNKPNTIEDFPQSQSTQHDQAYQSFAHKNKLPKKYKLDAEDNSKRIKKIKLQSVIVNQKTTINSNSDNSNSINQDNKSINGDNSHQNSITTVNRSNDHLLTGTIYPDSINIAQADNILIQHNLGSLAELKMPKIYLTGTQTPEYPEVSTTIIHPNKKSKHFNPWDIELFCGLGFPIKNTTFDKNKESLSDAPNDGESPWYTLSAGIYAGYTFKNNLSIYSGLDYLMIVENFKYENHNKLKYFAAPNAFNLNTGWYAGVETTVGDIRYSMLSIPVQVGYKLSGSKWTFEPRIGLNYNFYARSEGFILNLDGTVTKRENNSPRISTLGFGYTFATNIEYKAGTHFGLFLRPQLNLFPNKFNISSQSLKVGYTVPDLRVGLHYSF